MLKNITGFCPETATQESPLQMSVQYFYNIYHLLKSADVKQFTISDRG